METDRRFFGSERKIYRDWVALHEAVQGLHPLVFTNGVFDILHLGHIHSLEAARAQGAYLVVGVNSDVSVRCLGKGEDRPIQREADRAHILAALACVDFVTIFEDDTPTRLIEMIVPDVLVKGGDYHIDHISGADFVLQRDGRVVTIDFDYDRSTTKIIEKIRGHV